MKKGTFFYKTCLKTKDIMLLAVLWLSVASTKSAISLTGHSSTTVCSFYKHFRQLVSSALDERNDKIGGPGIVVEIDETKMGKRKYHRGHRVDGVWILVGIERTTEKKIFLIQIENRSNSTLKAIIEKNVLPGSIIYTDLWKGYRGLDELGMKHHTVNHSKFFKDPITGVCTNTVEGLNNGLKTKITARNRTKKNIDGHLGEYIWRRLNKDNLFKAFICAIRNIHYDV